MPRCLRNRRSISNIPPPKSERVCTRLNRIAVFTQEECVCTAYIVGIKMDQQTTRHKFSSFGFHHHVAGAAAERGGPRGHQQHQTQQRPRRTFEAVEMSSIHVARQWNGRGTSSTTGKGKICTLSSPSLSKFAISFFKHTH